ncbi:hypothetical protein ABIA33_002012 [Streptacidiphilus sp. MAP12-16]|uniref:hypothetical protein n=1 Tax=Streptacidiphilus sp. MAP12-16 TaxID=3156300 RepID=UPI0035189E04
MADVLVEENFARIAGEDMSVILDMFNRMGIRADPTGPRIISERRRWVLSLHWLRQGPVPEATQERLPQALVEVRRHLVAVGKVPPMRLDLYGPGEQLLLSVEPQAEAV